MLDERQLEILLEQLSEPENIHLLEVRLVYEHYACILIVAIKLLGHYMMYAFSGTEFGTSWLSRVSWTHCAQCEGSFFAQTAARIAISCSAAATT